VLYHDAIFLDDTIASQLMTQINFTDNFTLAMTSNKGQHQLNHTSSW